MAKRNTLHQQQRAFAGHIRDPQNTPAPEGVEDRRMAIYRDLFFNNVAGFISSGFPVLKQLYSEQDWERLARDFFVHHRCRTPLFLEIAQEFIDYLQNEHEPQPEDPPFLLELAHYEWVELAVSVDDTALPTDVDAQGDLLDGRPLLSPLAWPLTYTYPVHRIGPDFRPQAPGEPVHLLVYRNPDEEVSFMELNPVTARLLQLIGEQPEASGRQLMQQIADELEHPDPGAVLDGGLQTLEELRSSGVILGVRRGA
jgi:uncharacterized protein